MSPTKEAGGKDGKRHRYPSRARQSKPLGIARSTSCYKRKEGESQRNLKMMDYLKGEGCHVGKNLVRRLMALIGLRAVCPLKSLSMGGWIKYRMPSLMSIAVI